MEPGFYLLFVSQKKTQSLVPISIPISSLIGRTCPPIRSVNWYDLPGFPHASQDSLRVDFGFLLSLVGCPVYCVLREKIFASGFDKAWLRGEGSETRVFVQLFFSFFFFFLYFVCFLLSASASASLIMFAWLPVCPFATVSLSLFLDIPFFVRGYAGHRALRAPISFRRNLLPTSYID